MKDVQSTGLRLRSRFPILPSTVPNVCCKFSVATPAHTRREQQHVPEITTHTFPEVATCGCCSA